MAVFRRIFDISKTALFALMFAFVSIFPQFASADEAQVPDYFMMKVVPDASDSIFTFSISAAGCYDIYWDCPATNSTDAQCSSLSGNEREETKVIDRSSESYNYSLDANVKVSHLTKTFTGSTSFYKKYRNSNDLHFIKIKRVVCNSVTPWAGYDNQKAAIDFIVMKAGHIGGNLGLRAIYGSLGAVFPTIEGVTNTQDEAGDLDHSSSQQPLFLSTFYGCSELAGNIPEYLFAGIKGTPVNSMFSGTFQGCSKLTGNIPNGLFGNFDDGSAIPAAMFAGTFYGCSNLEGDIPEGLFKGLAGSVKSEMFMQTFTNCSKLTGIPESLFTNFGTFPAVDKLRGIENAYKETFKGCTGIKSIYWTDKQNIRHDIHYLRKDFLGNVDLTFNGTDTSGNPKITDGMFEGVPNLHLVPGTTDQYEGIAEVTVISDILPQIENYDDSTPAKRAESICNFLIKPANGQTITAYINGLDAGLYRDSEEKQTTTKLICNVSSTSSEKKERVFGFYSNCEDGIVRKHSIYNNEWNDVRDPVTGGVTIEPMFKAKTWEGYPMPAKDLNENPIRTPPNGCPGYTFAGYKRIGGVDGSLDQGVLHYTSLLKAKGKWVTVTDTSVDPNIDYLELYADWKPNVYTITFDNIGNANNTPNDKKLPSHASLTGGHVSSKNVYEKYGDGLYTDFNQGTVTVMGDKITHIDPPEAIGAEFLGYRAYNSFNNTWLHVVDANGNFIVDGHPEYDGYSALATATVPTDMEFHAQWAPKTVIRFKCKNKTNINQNIVLKTMIEDGDVTSISSDEFPTLEQVTSSCQSDDWNNQRKALAWICSIGSREKIIYKKGDSGYDNLTFNSSDYDIQCSPKNAPKVYTLILDHNNGITSEEDRTDELFLSGIPSWIENGKTDPYEEFYFVNREDAYGTTTNVGDGKVSGASWSPAYTPKCNKDAKFTGYYTEIEDGEKMVTPPLLKLPSPDPNGEAPLAKDVFTNQWVTTWYARFENTKTEYAFHCHKSSSSAALSGFIENNVPLAGCDANGEQQSGQHACLGGSDLSTYTLCNVPDNGQYSQDWWCNTYDANDHLIDEEVTYSPVATGSGALCNNNQITTDGTIKRVFCWAKSVPPSYSIGFKSFKNNNVPITLYEKYGINFYSSAGFSSTSEFDTAWSNPEQQSNIHVVSKILDNYQTPGDYDLCKSGTIFIGYYPRVADGNTATQADGSSTPISYGGKPYVNYNGDIIMNPLTFKENTVRSPSCLVKDHYYKAFFCSEDIPLTQISSEATAHKDSALVFPTIDKPMDQHNNSQYEFLCPQQETQVNNGQWKCKIYTFSGSSNAEPAVTLDYQKGITEDDWLDDYKDDMYRIDCFAQWTSNKLEINLHANGADNTGTEKLYTVYSDNIYYNSETPQIAANTLQEKDIEDAFRYKEPTRDMYVFKGYSDAAEGGQTYINPRSGHTELNHSLYNNIVGRAANLRLTYTPYNKDLYAQWSQIYKINLDASASGVLDGYLQEIYTDRTYIYPNQLFNDQERLGTIGESSDASLYEDHLPVRTGYNFVGYYKDNNQMVNNTGGFTDGDNGGKYAVAHVSSEGETWTARWKAKIVKITLDDDIPVANQIRRSGDGAFYIKYEDGLYTNIEATTPVNKNNNVYVVTNIPDRLGYIFKGYSYEDETTHDSVKCVNANGEILISTKDYTEPITCKADWEEIDCSPFADKYFDEASNSCQTCGATTNNKYPNINKDSGYTGKGQCFTTIVKYNKFGDVVDNNSQTTFDKYYDDNNPNGYPISELTSEISSILGYAFDGWQNASSESINDTLLSGASTTVYAHYSPVDITYKIYCDRTKATAITTTTGAFGTEFNLKTYKDDFATTCSNKYNTNDFVNWNCSSATNSQTEITADTILWNQDEGPVECYANWTPTIFNIILDHQNNKNQPTVGELSVKFGKKFYRNNGNGNDELDYGNNIWGPNIIRPTLVGNKFLGYYTCPNQNSNNYTDCRQVIDRNGNIQIHVNDEIFNKTNAADGDTVTFYAHWELVETSIVLYNSSISGGTANPGQGKLYFAKAEDADEVTVADGEYFATDTIGTFLFTENTINVLNDIQIKKLPTLKIGNQYYAFNGYKNTADGYETVDSKGYLISDGENNGFKDILKVLDGQEGITWTAQWKPIYKIDLNATDEGVTTVVEPNGFYTDKEKIYSDTFLIGGVTVTNQASIVTQTPVRTGHSFAGFGNGYIDVSGKLTSAGAIAINGLSANATWNAQWDPNIVEIKLQDNYNNSTTKIWEKYGDGFYNNNTGTGDSITSVDVPTYTGHTFLGYFVSTDDPTPVISNTGSISFANNTYTITDSPVTLYARWTANTYTVIFKQNAEDVDGSMANQSFTYGVEQALNANTYTKQGYTFDGWCQAADDAEIPVVCDISSSNYRGSGATVSNLTENNENVYLYARWKANGYRVIFNGNGSDGGDPMANQTFTYDVPQTLNANTYTKTGYGFAGWCEDSACSQDVKYQDRESVKNLAVNGDKTLYAKWKANTYTVKFDKNGAVYPDYDNATMQDQIFTYDKSQHLRTNTYKNLGYSFAGWCKNVMNCEITSANYIADGASVINLTEEAGADVILYAQWNANGYPIKYMVDGVNRPDSVTENNTYIYSLEPQEKEPTQPTKVGYTFDGWCSTPPNVDDESAENCPVKITIPKRQTGELTYYAKWSLKRITCEPGYYLPINSEVCDAPCTATSVGKNQWCDGQGVFTISTERNQGIVDCPAIVDYTGAAVVKPSYDVLSIDIDSNENHIKDSIGDCGAIFGYSYDAENVGTKVDAKLGYNIITAGSIRQNNYNPNSEFNKNTAWAVSNCLYNAESGRYDNCLPSDVWLGVVCANGYYIPQDKIHYNLSNNIDAITTTYTEFENICVKGAADYYTTLYNMHESDELATKVGVGTAAITGAYKDAISNVSVSGLDNLYTHCPAEYRRGPAGSWDIANCYATVEFRDIDSTPLFNGATETHDFNGNLWVNADNSLGVTPFTYNLETTDIPHRNNYEFVAWYTNLRYSGNEIHAGSALSGDVTLYPKYEQTARDITIYFENSVNIEVPNIPTEPLHCVMGEECVYKCGGVNDTPCPARDEYEQVTWNLRADGTGQSFAGVETDDGIVFDLSSIFGFVLNSNETVLYAIWTPTEYNIEYHLKGGTAENPIKYDVDTPPFRLNNPVKEGNEFLGWCAEVDDCARPQLTYTIPNSAIVRNAGVPLHMYAMWKAQKYRVEFNENGGVSYKRSVECTYGTECDVSNNNEVFHNNHVFLGWDEDQNATVPTYPQTENGIKVINLTAEDNGVVVLYAIWSADTINLRYVYNDDYETINTSSCSYDSRFRLPVLSSEYRPGYRFVGWYVETNPTDDGNSFGGGTGGGSTGYPSNIADYTEAQCYSSGLIWCKATRFNSATGMYEETTSCAVTCASSSSQQ